MPKIAGQNNFFNPPYPFGLLVIHLWVKENTQSLLIAYCPTNILYCHNLPSLQAKLVQGQLLFECEMSLTDFYGGKNKRECVDKITSYDRII